MRRNAGVAVDAVGIDQSGHARAHGRLRIHAQAQPLADLAEGSGDGVDLDGTDVVCARAQFEVCAERAVGRVGLQGREQLGFVDDAVVVGIVENPNPRVGAGNAGDGQSAGIAVGDAITVTQTQVLGGCQCQGVGWCLQ